MLILSAFFTLNVGPLNKKPKNPVFLFKGELQREGHMVNYPRKPALKKEEEKEGKKEEEGEEFNLSGLVQAKNGNGIKINGKNGKKIILSGWLTRFKKKKIIENTDRYLATHDWTGVLNRVGFSEIMEQRLPRTQIACLLFLDLDGLKKVNDSCGYPAGDGVIMMAIDVLTSILRSRGGEDIICRYGGDEFFVFLDGMGPGEAEPIAERIRAEMDGLCWVDGKFRITVSIGLVEMSRKVGKNLGRALWLASKALRQAKYEGRNRVVVSSHRSVKGGKVAKIAVAT